MNGTRIVETMIARTLERHSRECLARGVWRDRQKLQDQEHQAKRLELAAKAAAKLAEEAAAKKRREEEAQWRAVEAKRRLKWDIERERQERIRAQKWQEEEARLRARFLAEVERRVQSSGVDMSNPAQVAWARSMAEVSMVQEGWVNQ